MVQKFGGQIGEVLTKRLSGKDTRDHTILTMSSIGRPLRQLWYQLKGYPGEELTGQTIFKFLYGDVIEALVLVLAEASGHKVERLQEEISVDGVKGHIDAVIDGVLVDVKSCSPYSFDKFEDKTLFQNDPFGYIGQLSGYCRATNLPGYFIAVEKVNGRLCILELPKEKIDEYDVRDRIKKISQASSRDTPPERCYPDEPDGKSGNRKLSVGCSYCSHRFECWKESNGGRGLQVYFYSTGPRYLTEVVREPKVFKEKQEGENPQ